MKICVGCHRRFVVEASEERIANIKCEENWLFKDKKCDENDDDDEGNDNRRDRRRNRRKNRRCNRETVTQIIDVCESECRK